MSEIANTSLTKGRLALQKGASFRDVQEALKFHPDVHVHAPEVEKPKRVELSQVAQEALENLPKVFNGVDPDVPRLLTEEERLALLKERDTIQALEDEISARKERIKETFRNHQDRQAEAEGLVDETSPKDARGHYIVAKPGETYRTPIPGAPTEISQEYRAGRVSVDEEALKELAEEDRKTYLAFTREKRVFDEEKAMDYLQKNPDALENIVKVTKRGEPTTALYFRKPKKK